jgi:hypothetical protein
MAFSRLLGTYFGVGGVYGIYLYQDVNLERHLLKSPEVKYKDEDIKKLQKLVFCMGVIGWPYFFYDNIKYEDIPYDWNKMTLVEKRFYISSSKFMLYFIRGWDSEKRIGENVVNFIESCKGPVFETLDEDMEEATIAFDKERKVRTYFRRMQDE